MNSVYSNNLIYGNSMLAYMYPNHNMEMLCTLSSIPDSSFGFFCCVFFLELRKLRMENDENNGGKITLKGYLKIVLSILLRIAMNPIIWATLIGVNNYFFF
jgi:hypothetical protein